MVVPPYAVQYRWLYCKMETHRGPATFVLGIYLVIFPRARLCKCSVLTNNIHGNIWSGRIKVTGTGCVPSQPRKGLHTPRHTVYGQRCIDLQSYLLILNQVTVTLFLGKWYVIKLFELTLGFTRHWVNTPVILINHIFIKLWLRLYTTLNWSWLIIG